MDVVAEQKPIADGDHVAGNAVVVGGDPLGGQQLGLDRAEDVLAASFSFSSRSRSSLPRGTGSRLRMISYVPPSSSIPAAAAVRCFSRSSHGRSPISHGGRGLGENRVASETHRLDVPSLCTIDMAARHARAGRFVILFAKRPPPGGRGSVGFQTPNHGG